MATATIVTYAGMAALVGRSVASVCVCLSVCPSSNRKTAWAINTKLGTHILYSSRSACIDPDVKRSKVKVTWLRKLSEHTVASDHGRYPVSLYAAVQPAAVASVGLNVDKTAYVF